MTTRLAEVSFVPRTLDLELYAGDGASLTLTVTDPVTARPVPLLGVVTAEIKVARADAEPAEPFIVGVAENVVALKLSAAQTMALGDFKGVWDCQWAPPGEEPRTLMRGSVVCVLDVTR